MAERSAANKKSLPEREKPAGVTWESWALWLRSLTHRPARQTVKAEACHPLSAAGFDDIFKVQLVVFITDRLE